LNFYIVFRLSSQSIQKLHPPAHQTVFENEQTRTQASGIAFTQKCTYKATRLCNVASTMRNREKHAANAAAPDAAQVLPLEIMTLARIGKIYYSEQDAP